MPSSNRKCSQKSGMNCLSCWRDDQHPVAQNDFGSGETVALDEVHHHAEISFSSIITGPWLSNIIKLEYRTQYYVN